MPGMASSSTDIMGGTRATAPNGNGGGTVRSMRPPMESPTGRMSRETRPLDQQQRDLVSAMRELARMRRTFGGF